MLSTDLNATGNKFALLHNAFQNKQKKVRGRYSEVRVGDMSAWKSEGKSRERTLVFSYRERNNFTMLKILIEL